MSKVTIYTTQRCPYCVNAKRLLQSKGVTPYEINVEESPQHLAEMIQRAHRRTVPQIFVGSVHVGGFDDLASLDRQGRLEALLHA
ncbi:MULTISPECIES: glutaredoxin 3 [Pseudomonas]|uniref:Glutaredoxin n=1 Tax=Pseudomonas putida (strain W619) TaxID=390235 RepID=B1JAL6_PSEPW|nr:MULTISPECIES: glutaredoxin 3 [Pseudomonas]MDH1571975.1 glutaredoxin 3 [Pseudomonas sp. GD03746]QQE82224.1 glutaredoxin 3 [Pseudomonas putida]UTL79571.1 glutaredoxin 3 [Pseudomonas putida]HEN8713459.1 glutaredoxin 3 [Pseudomonas putida]HEN8718516.1 glutaredoxin 3 [Pseudomonas putida]